MNSKSYIAYGAVLITLFALSAIAFYPSIVATVFLAATLVVTAISILSGMRAAVASYVLISLIIFALPIRDHLGLEETLIRFFGFTVVAAFLSVLGARLKEYKHTIETKEKRLQIISDSLSDSLITIDNKSTIVFANPATEEMFGYTQEELIGLPLTTLMPERYREKHLDGFSRYLRTKKKTVPWKGMELEAVRKSGEEFPIEISYGEYKDGDKDYFSAIIRDITARKDFDKRMAQFAAIVESSEDAIIGKSVNGTITSWNKGAEKMFGYKEEEILGKNIVTLFPEDKKEEERVVLEKLIKGITISSYETVRKKKDGTLFPVSLTISPIKNRSGLVVGASKIVRDISGRKKFEERLRASEERYKSFIKHSSEGIWRVELSSPISVSLPTDEQVELILERGVFAECNQAMARMYGYREPEDIVGKPVTFLLPDNEKTRNYLKMFIENGYHLENVESEEVGANGETLYFSNSLVAVIELDSISRAWGVQRDLTEIKKHQNEIEKSKERYKAFIENSEEAIWMIEYRPPVDINAPVEEQIDQFFSNGYITEANETMARLYGIEDVSTILGKNSSVVSKRSPEGEEFLRKFIEMGYSIRNHESHAETPEGTRYGSVSFKGIIQDDKLLRGWVVQRETTEQKLQEEQLKKSEERYKTFIENSDEGISRVEFSTPIPTSLPINEQIEKFFEVGYLAEANSVTMDIIGTSEDILGKSLKEIDMDRKADERFLRAFIENGYSLSNFESEETRNGRRVYHSSSMKGIIENGEWVRSWIVRRDVTPFKEGELEKEKLLEQAEEAKRELEIASAEKDRFLANLSHELRTPLVSILGYSAMLMETEPDSENARKMIETINKNAKLQVQLIEDLLDLSRIISGKIELVKEFFSTEEFAEDAIATLRPQAEAKGLKIIERIDSCQFYGDRKRLSQVILNLLSNAIKFTNTGEITVCVRCSAEYLTIKVTDTGIGIDSSSFHLLFQPFKQLDSSITRSKQGLGLGLSIVKNITELHQGKVSVNSKLGEGSEFTVHLPVVQPPEAVEGQDDIHITPSITFEGIRILLVEDDPDSADFVKYLYEQKGAEVDWVDSAKEAREKLKTNEYDLYLFDLSMPDEDGISLIKFVRESGDKTKAVALTAFADAYYEKMALDAGFDMFLKKPSSLTDLLSVIKLIR